MMRLIKKLIPIALKDKVKVQLKRWVNGSELVTPSTSHCGEDRILAYLLKQRKNGFFVDIGAFHPIDSSNTYLFYKRGWRGINIDPFPGSMKAFQSIRPEDKNLEIGVGPNEETMTYYKIGEGHHQMNGFNPDFQENLFKEFGIDPSTVQRIPIKVFPLSTVLKEHLPNGKQIDFLTLDVEGFEEQVLASNDWKTYRPVVVMVENHKPISPELLNSSLCKLMESKNYGLVFKSPNELIFLNNDFELNKSGIVNFG